MAYSRAESQNAAAGRGLSTAYCAAKCATAHAGSNHCLRLRQRLLNAGQPIPTCGVEPNICQSDSDCRGYSSFCADYGCVCIPLHVDDPDPVCTQGQIQCFADPCAVSPPVVCNAGTCEIQ